MQELKQRTQVQLVLDIEQFEYIFVLQAPITERSGTTCLTNRSALEIELLALVSVSNHIVIIRALVPLIYSECS